MFGSCFCIDRFIVLRKLMGLLSFTSARPWVMLIFKDGLSWLLYFSY